jgi:hypothetical protein
MNEKCRWLILGMIGLGMLGLVSCGSSGGSSPPPPIVGTQQPTTINLYPSANDGSRLFVMITAVGGTSVAMPLIFDTGSAGITLYAPDIFPSTMVGESGFIFPVGQTSLTYNGITVTNQSGVRKYGDATTGRSQAGNIGYAQITFGDAAGEVTTGVMPVFLYYSVTDNASGQQLPPTVQSGVFGVNDAPNLISVTGTTEPAGGYPACAADTEVSCYVVSVLKYVQYPAGLNAGFMLTPASLESCDITVAGNCSPQPILTIGLTAALESTFSTVQLVCPPTANPYPGPASIAGYPVCQMIIPDTTMTVSGATNGTLTGNVLFDSGTPYMVFNTPAGSAFPTAIAPGSSVLVQTPSGFSYGYTAGSQLTSTSASSNSTVVYGDNTNESIVGIDYFTSNSFFIDFTASREGWK